MRTENQDRMSWVRAPAADVFVVLDGMGGHAGGGIAAELAVEVLQRHFANLTSLASAQEALRNAFSEANAEVYARSQSADPTTHGMGTTAVAMLARDARIMLAHVGDSRAYLFGRDGRLRGLTRDHSRVQRMIDAGLLTHTQAAHHPDAGILERALGHTAQVDVEVSGWMRVRAGETCLLCSDGLCGYVGDADIAAVMQGGRTPQELADELVRLALQRGGEDNVTVQVLRYEGRPGLLPRSWSGAVARAAGAVFAPAMLVGALALYWLPAPTQLAPEHAFDTRIAKLEDVMQRDRDLANERYARMKTELDEINARLDPLDRRVAPAKAGSTPASSHAQKRPPEKSRKMAAGQRQQEPQERPPGPSQESRQPPRTVTGDAPGGPGADRQGRPETVPVQPGTDGGESQGVDR
ncbi:protein phosphatase 2C domain-containing protein [Paraburkholderia sp. GAS334]|uniref:PP2C family protein-serine/threonine phosphatase n=1 Tax=Paraburkholderia sp. GAS334 TaxID=3035131 RepID=UPI003D1ED8A7